MKGRINMKKLFCIMTAIIMALSALPAYAEQEITVSLNGEKLVFDVSPIIVNDRTLVPMRTIFEALGAEVTWDNTARTAVAVKGGDVIKIAVDSDIMLLNGAIVRLDVPARIVEERTLVPLRAVSEGLGADVNWNNDKREVEIKKSIKTKRAASASDILNAIESDCEIIVEPGEYLLTGAEFDNKNVTASEVYDGEEYIFSNISNLTIRTEDGEHATITVSPRYANVMTFENCGNITLKGLTLGHTIEEGFCTGGVLNFINSSNVNIDMCNMYGCGIYGIMADGLNALNVTNSEIYECTDGIMNIRNVKSAVFDNVKMHDCGEFGLIVTLDCESVEFTNCEIYENRGSTLFYQSNSNVSVKNSKIHDNLCDKFSEGDITIE